MLLLILSRDDETTNRSNFFEVKSKETSCWSERDVQHTGVYSAHKKAAGNQEIPLTKQSEDRNVGTAHPRTPLAHPRM